MATNLLLAPEIQKTYDRKLLSRFRSSTVFNKFGKQKDIPANGGVNIDFRRMEVIRPVAIASSVTWPADAVYTTADAIALVEGTFGGGQTAVSASWYNVTATVRQYGQYSYQSEWNDSQAIDPQTSEYVSNYSEAMAELLDIVTRDVLVAGTTVQYVNGRANISAVISGDFINSSSSARRRGP